MFLYDYLWWWSVKVSQQRQFVFEFYGNNMSSLAQKGRFDVQKGLKQHIQKQDKKRVKQLNSRSL